MYTCNQCERTFQSLSNQKRHFKRKKTCRKSLHPCNNCKKVYASKESLRKHQKLYCKLKNIKEEEEEKENIKPPPSPFVQTEDNDDDLYEVICNQNPLTETIIDMSSSLKELYESLCPPTPDKHQIAQDDAQKNEIPTSLYHLNDMLLMWMDEILCMEGKFKNTIDRQTEAIHAIDRMLEDGLLNVIEHGNLVYTTQIFSRLQDLINMNMFSIHKREIIELLATLLETQRITKTAFVELLVNIYNSYYISNSL